MEPVLSFPKELFVLRTYLMKMDKCFPFKSFKGNMTVNITNFPTFYQVINAIPKTLITKACNQDKPLKNY